jgi:hypothetical protein
MTPSKHLLEKVKRIAQQIVLAEDEYDRYRDRRATGDWDDIPDNRRLPSPVRKTYPKAKVPMVKQYLNVPYAEREEAKKMGARWDPAVKKWYMPVFSGTHWSPYGYEHWIIK